MIGRIEMHCHTQLVHTSLTSKRSLRSIERAQGQGQSASAVAVLDRSSRRPRPRIRPTERFLQGPCVCCGTRTMNVLVHTTTNWPVLQHTGYPTNAHWQQQIGRPRADARSLALPLHCEWSEPRLLTSASETTGARNHHRALRCRVKRCFSKLLDEWVVYSSNLVRKRSDSRATRGLMCVQVCE